MLDTSRFDLIRLLAAQPLFAEIERGDLYRVAQGSHIRQLARGEIVLRQGEACDALHVVLSGQVKLFALSPAGQEKVLELVGPGGSFGEAQLFQRRACMASAEALAETLLLSVQREAVLEEVRRSSGFAMRMLAGLSRRTLGLEHDLQAQTLQSGVERVAGYLLGKHEDLAPANGGHTVSLKVSKATIASLLSLTPEYFSRVLRDLEQAGLIEVARRDIRIVDPDRLAALRG